MCVVNNLPEAMNKVVKIVINVVLSLLVVVLGYILYDEIFSPYYFSQNKEARYTTVKERFNDIILAQEAYKNVKKVFSSDFDSLTSVLKNDSIMQIRAFGQEGDTVKIISVKEAIILFNIDPDLSKDKLIDIISRSVNAYNEQLKAAGGDAITSYKVEDTTYVPVLSTIDLMTDPDSLQFIPHSKGDKFEMEASVLEVGLGRVKVPVFEVRAYNKSILKGEDHRFYNGKNGLQLGSLYEASMDITEIIND